MKRIDSGYFLFTHTLFSYIVDALGCLDLTLGISLVALFIHREWEFALVRESSIGIDIMYLNV